MTRKKANNEALADLRKPPVFVSASIGVNDELGLYHVKLQIIMRQLYIDTK